MLFHSSEFLLLLVVVLVFDRLAFARLARVRGWNVRCAVYLAASLVFYAWWKWPFLSLLLGICVFDWWAGLRIASAASRTSGRAWLVGSLAANLGLLFVFKYLDFVLATFHVATSWASGAADPVVVGLILPLGISFHTFQSMSYTIDVYRGEVAAVRSLPRFALFVSFFPQLVAGPIVRAKDFLWQLDVPKRPSDARLFAGIERFAVGLFKKTVIADNLTPLTDLVFADPSKFGGANNLAALCAWAVVIYCDFSGYSDMAIGLARMLGFKFMENFNFPYLARSVTDFWKRWHISLSSWLRDYLYIPLGGNRRGFAHTLGALMLTMLLGGLWHGASWNFVLWGAWWGAWLCVAHLWRRAPEAARRLVPAWLAWSGTLAVAVLGWAPFRCQGLERTAQMLGKIFSAETLASLAHGRFVELREFPVGRSAAAVAAAALAVVVVVHAAGFALGLDRQDPWRRPAWVLARTRSWLASDRPYLRASVVAAFVVVTVLLRSAQSESFIYFQF